MVLQTGLRIGADRRRRYDRNRCSDLPRIAQIKTEAGDFADPNAVK